MVAMDEPAATCQLCGRSQTEAADRLAWVTDRRDGRISWICPGCATENIRSLEAKLEPEWW